MSNSNHIRTFETEIFESRYKNRQAEVPVVTMSGYPGVQVSSRWSPSAQLEIVQIEVSVALTYGIGRFAILKGFNNKVVDLNDPWDTLMLGGLVVQWVTSGYTKTQTVTKCSIPLAPSEWIAVGSYDENNPVVSPSIRFYAEVQP